MPNNSVGLWDHKYSIFLIIINSRAYILSHTGILVQLQRHDGSEHYIIIQYIELRI